MDLALSRQGASAQIDMAQEVDPPSGSSYPRNEVVVLRHSARL